MTEIIELRCEKCGATLEFTEETKVSQCRYCGGQFLVTDSEEIHLHEETHLHEHYGTDGKSFSQLKYLKKMLEGEIKETRSSYQFKKQRVDALSSTWLEAIDERKEWASGFIVTGLILIAFNGFHSWLLPSGIMVFILGLIIYFTDPSEQYNRYITAQKDFDLFTVEASGLIEKNQGELKHIKECMLKAV